MFLLPLYGEKINKQTCSAILLLLPVQIEYYDEREAQTLEKYFVDVPRCCLYSILSEWNWPEWKPVFKYLRIVHLIA